MSNPFHKNIPTEPGCYLMKDAVGKVIYVGKAKQLRKRVSSYWRARDYKTAVLVSEISDIDTIVTDTEEEALILEAQLIQTHHPKYNIVLQSPGRYAFIKLTQEEYPRFVLARKVTKDGKFFGPYPSAAARNQMLRSINGLFQLCSIRHGSALRAGLRRDGVSRRLSARRGVKERNKPCFRYHLGQCAGACAALAPTKEHEAAIAAAVRFLRGEFSVLTRETEELMRDAARHERYEQAAIYLARLRALQKREEQKLSAPKSYDQDIVNYIILSSIPNGGIHTSHQNYRDSSAVLRNDITIQIFHFNRGIISGRKEFTFDFDAVALRKPAEALRDFLFQYYESHATPSEIVIPEHIPDAALLEKHFRKKSGRSVSFVIPKRGVKKKLLDLVKKNLVAKIGEGGGQLYELQRALRISMLPRIITCVDISHLGGTETVGSLVQFVNGQPTKSGYRKFIIKGTNGNNDTAAIYEVVTRFGKRIADNKEKKPDLLIIDGGKGQLNSALRALRELHLDIPLIGLAKRLEEVFAPREKDAIIFPPKSAALQLLRAVRDEAHRFAITFQRKRRNKII